MTTDEARDYLIDRFMPHEPWHVRVFLEGLEVGQRTIKEKVSKSFKFSNVEWDDERTT
jgi:hypothetical protein